MAFRRLWGLSDRGNDIDWDYNKKAGRTYEMFFDVGDDDIYVRNNCGIGLFSPHPSDSSMLVSSISVSEGDKTQDVDISGVSYKCRLYTVAVSYSSLTANKVAGGPLQQPATFSMVPYLKTEPAYKDYNGNPILNTAGDPYNPALEYERTCYTLTITRNESNPDFAALQAMGNKTNSGTWLIFPAKTAKSNPIEIPERQYDNESSQYYHAMKYVFDIDPLDWRVKVVNQGFRELKSGKLVKIVDENNDPVDDPVLLAANGTKLTYPVTSSSIIIKAYDMIEPVSFSGFGMDTIFDA